MGSLEMERARVSSSWSSIRELTVALAAIGFLMVVTGAGYSAEVAGDIDYSGRVDGTDLWLYSLAQGAELGDPDYNPDIDINKDGIINEADLAVLTANFAFTGRGLYVWVGDFNNDQIVKLLLANGDEKLRQWLCDGPAAITADNRDGSIWVACTNSNVVIKLAMDGEELVRVVGFSAPRNLDLNETTGEVWVANRSNNSIVKLAPDVPNNYNISTQTGYHVKVLGFNAPMDVSVNDRNGNVWVADTNNSRIVKLFDGIADGYNISSNTGFHYTKGGFNYPNAVSVNIADGTCWVADTNNDHVVKLSPSGSIEMMRRSGFDNPVDVSVNHIDGTCWVADWYLNKVVHLDPAGNILSTIPDMLNPLSVSVNPQDGSCWVADHGRNQVVKIIVSGTEAARKSGFSNPYAVEVIKGEPIMGAPSASAVVNPVKAQIGQTVYFEGTATDDGEIILYEWDFTGDGTYDWSSTDSGSTTYSYQANGIFNPVFRVTDNHYLTDVDYSQIIRIGVLQAFASAAPLTGNAPLTVTFSAGFFDPDNNSVLSYQWDFDGDGFYDSYQNATQNPMTINYTYATAGTYTATLKVTDTGNVIATAGIEIAVNKTMPTATANASPLQGAAPLHVTFQGTGADPDGQIMFYEWDFEGDGTYDWFSATSGVADHIYLAKGIYDAWFRVTDNDGQTATSFVTINVTSIPPVAEASASPLKGNAPLAVTFTGTAIDPDGYILFYLWDFNGDGTFDYTSFHHGNTSYVYTTPGTYQAQFRVVDNDGGEDAVTIVVTVVPTGYPVAVAEADPENGYVLDEIGLIGENSYDANGSIVLYEWDVSGGTMFFDDCEQGVGDWVAQSPWGLTAEDYYSSTKCWTDSPGGLYGNSINLALTSESLNLPPATATTLRFWQRYQTENSYDVCRVEISTNGGTNWTQIGSYTGTNSAWHRVDYDISAYHNKPDVKIRYRLTSDGSVTYDGWYLDDIMIFQDFNPGSSSSEPNTTAVYDQAGNYNAVLRVTDNDANQDMDQTMISVSNGLPVPEAEADPDSGAAPLTTDLLGHNSTDPNGTIELYEWDYEYYYFYDGMENGADQWLTKGSAWGLIESGYTGTYAWTESPSGNYANNYDSSIVSIQFSLANATAPTLTFWYKLTANQNYSYYDSGRVYISTNDGINWTQLASYNYYNNTTTWTQASVDLSSYAGESGLRLRFRFLSDSNYNEAGWIIDDITVSEEFTPDYTSATIPDSSFTYDEPGYHHAGLRVTDDDGFSVIEVVPIRALAGPTAEVYNPLDNASLKRGRYSFFGEGYDIDGRIILYEWDFDGDGTYDYTSAEAGGAVYEFTAVGAYTAYFRVTDNDGLFDVAAVAYTVEQFAPVITAFTASPMEGNVPVTVYFTVTVTDSDGTIAQYEWDWEGDGTYDQTTTTNNPNRYYTVAGTYPVKVRVTDNDGLSSEATVTIYLKPAGYPTATASVSPGYGCLGQVFSFNGSGSDSGGSITKYEWDFDDDGVYDWESTTTGVTTYSYPEVGIFTPRLRVTDNSGYVDTDSTTVRVDYDGCLGSSVWLTSLGGDRVYRFTNNVKVWEATGFYDPHGISVDPADESVWVADYYNNRVVKLSGTGNVLYTITGISYPWDVGVYHADGSVWVTSHSGHQLILLSSTGVELHRIGGFYYPIGVAVDQSDGSVWVADHSNHDAVKVALDGTILARIQTFNYPEYVAVNQEDGSCWVSSRDQDQVALLSASGAPELLRLGGFFRPYQIAPGWDSSCWLSDIERDRVYHISREGVVIGSRYFADPYGLAQDFSTLGVWVADYYAHTLTRLAPNGRVLFTFSSLNYPYDLDVLPAFTSDDLPPAATVSADPMIGDAPLEVTFTGTATDNGTIVSYEWDFTGDGVWDFISATTGDATYTYTTPGIYTPIFRAVDDEGLSGFGQELIVRVGPFQATATASPTSGNANLNVSLSGSAASPLGDGINHLFQWDYEPNGVYDWSAWNSVSNTKSYGSGQWVPTLKVTDSAGNYSIAVANPIFVNDSYPTAVIYTSASSGTSPLTIRMHGNSSSDPDGTIVFWEWDFDGDGAYDYGSATTSDIYYTYDLVGTFQLGLRITDNEGYTGTATRTITVNNAIPTAFATAAPLEGNAPLTVNFHGIGADREGPISLYEWDFGDAIGFTDDMESNGDNWTATGTWARVTTTSHSPTTCWTDSPAGNYLPYANMAITSANFSIPGGTDASLQFWHKYVTQTNYDYCYVDISTNGGTNFTNLRSYSGTASWKEEIVDISSYAGFSTTKIRFRFTSNSGTEYDGWYVDDVVVIDRGWDYSSTVDGDTSHEYSIPGYYTATFRVTDGVGAKATATVFLNVKSSGAPTATASADPTGGGIPLLVSFVGQGTDPDGTIAQYEWDFDGNGIWDYTSTVSGNALYRYNNGGRNYARLRVTDNVGLTDTDTIEIKVGVPTALPQAYPITGPAPLAVQFICNGSDDDGTIEYFYYDFNGDGANDLTERVTAAYTYTFTSPGIYNAKLTVVDNDGFSDSKILPITVTLTSKPSAYATASPDSGSPPLEVTFDGYGTDLDGTLELFEWDFDGDGIYDWSSTNSGNVGYVYTTVGDYKATFRVTDDSSEEATKSVWINVNPDGSPTALANGTPTSGATPLKVTFTGSGTDADGTIVLYEWDFDSDGIFEWSSPTTGNTMNVYTIPGTHEAVMRVTDNEGLTDTARVNIAAGMGISARRSKEGFDPSIGETIEIQSSLTGVTPITIRLINRDVQVVRTLIDNELRSPGYYSDVWDGTDDEGELVPSGVYFFIIDYEIDGVPYSYDVTGSSGSQVFPPVTYSSTYNPLTDNYLTATFTLSAPAEITTYVSPFSGSAGLRIRTIHSRVPQKSGPKVVVWDGTADDGSVAPLTQSYVIAVMMWSLSSNALIVDSEPKVGNISIDPNFYNPKNPYQTEPNAYCYISYNLSKDSDITVTVRNEEALFIKEILLPSQSAGVNYFYWDGSCFNGKLAYPEMYQVGIKATDSVGNESLTMHGIMKVFY